METETGKEGEKMRVAITSQGDDLEGNVDVRFGRDKPLGGIEYINEKIQSSVLDPKKITIIFISRWGKKRAGVPEKLKEIGEEGEDYEWIDISTGLEMIEIKDILDKRKKDD